MPKPRVFVSLIVEGYAEFREAARMGIGDAGGDAILVNEDFPALAVSSRNACLDAVDSSDVYVGIIGARGGWVTPSGKLVVEEEYERARAKRLPTLVFLQDVPREAEAQAFAQRISDYVDGSFRRRFTTSEELRREVARALEPLIENEVSVVRPPDELMNAFPSSERFNSGDPIVRSVIAPERKEEVFDTVLIGERDFQRTLLEIGHRREVGLFDYARGKEPSLKKGVLTIKEGGSRGGTPSIVVSLSEGGLMVADLAVGLGNRSLLGMVVAIDEIEEALQRVLGFYAGVMDNYDKYRRHNRFFFNVGLLNLGYRALERNPQPRQGMVIPMRSGGPIVAYDTPRIIGRDDLRAPNSEVERAIKLLTRKAEEDSH